MDWAGIWNSIKNFFLSNIWNIVGFSLAIGILFRIVFVVRRDYLSYKAVTDYVALCKRVDRNTVNIFQYSGSDTQTAFFAEQKVCLRRVARDYDL